MLVEHLPSFEFRRERWRNGSGWTREIVREPRAGDEAWQWRASIAEIDAGCIFSRFPGCDRQLFLMHGDGARLTFDDGGTLALEPRARAAFPGEQAPHCTPAGRLQVFNLIARREQLQVELLHRPLVGPMVFLPEAGVRWFALLLGGSATLPDTSRTLQLEQGDALLLTPEATAPRRVVMTGGGELLLARLSNRTGAPAGD